MLHTYISETFSFCVEERKVGEGGGGGAPGKNIPRRRANGKEEE